MYFLALLDIKYGILDVTLQSDDGISLSRLCIFEDSKGRLWYLDHVQDCLRSVAERLSEREKSRKSCIVKRFVSTS